MLKKFSKKYWLILLIAIFIIGGIVYHFSRSQKPLINKDVAVVTRVVPAENIILRPDQYQGYIGADGTINEIIDDNTFTLGCRDACLSMPVKFKTSGLKIKEEVVANGRLAKENGKYVFEAESVKPKLYEK